jgi:alkylhydroperoxidase family enzyme
VTLLAGQTALWLGLAAGSCRTRRACDAERAALASTEAVTRLSDRPDPVPDDLWAHAAEHYYEKGLAALLLMIAVTTVFNRLNVATRQAWT